MVSSYAALKINGYHYEFLRHFVMDQCVNTAAAFSHGKKVIGNTRLIYIVAKLYQIWYVKKAFIYEHLRQLSGMPPLIGNPPFAIMREDVESAARSKQCSIFAGGAN